MTTASSHDLDFRPSVKQNTNAYARHSLQEPTFRNKRPSPCRLRLLLEHCLWCVDEQLQQQRLSAMTAIVQALERGLREELNRLTALQEAA